ncbi:MAG: RsmD family RNA methyltransferase, partial [Alphaproteobacteria bacterium]
MRVIGGSWRGRQLDAPEGKAVRPTGDRAREAVFNILEHGRHTGGQGSPIPGARVLDAFAGSGALGIEALSRGAAQVTFVDVDRRATLLIAKNIARVGAKDA